MGYRSTCRMIAEFFSSILLLCSVAMLTFGGFLLYKWKNDVQTMSSDVPGYVIGIVGLGAAMALSNLLGFLGACTNVKFFLAASSTLSFILLMLQLVLSVVLFANPSAIDQKVCPPGDTKCLDKLDNLFKDPQAHAGVLLAVVCGIQLVGLCSVSCLRNSLLRRTEEEETDLESSLNRNLLQESEKYEMMREQLERKAKRKLDLHRAALSSVARAALEKRETAERPLPGRLPPGGVL